MELKPGARNLVPVSHMGPRELLFHGVNLLPAAVVTGEKLVLGAELCVRPRDSNMGNGSCNQFNYYTKIPSLRE